jgi:hypothetical protein
VLNISILNIKFHCALHITIMNILKRKRGSIDSFQSSKRQRIIRGELVTTFHIVMEKQAQRILDRRNTILQFRKTGQYKDLTLRTRQQMMNKWNHIHQKYPNVSWGVFIEVFIRFHWNRYNIKYQNACKWMNYYKLIQ